jgi:hypothetical protein
MTDVRYRFITEIAKDLLEKKPDSAHLYALERLQGSHTPEMWRQVLIELDKLQGEKNASTELQKAGQHRT